MLDSLPHVTANVDPHVQAHNDERDTINELASAEVPGTLSSIEIITASVTPSITYTPVVVQFSTLIVPPSDADVWLKWSGVFYLSSALSGNNGRGILQPYEYPKGGTITNIPELAVANVSSTDAVGTQYKVSGEWRLGPITTFRHFLLAVYSQKWSGSNYPQLGLLNNNGGWGRTRFSAVRG